MREREKGHLERKHWILKLGHNSRESFAQRMLWLLLRLPFFSEAGRRQQQRRAICSELLRVRQTDRQVLKLRLQLRSGVWPSVSARGGGTCCSSTCTGQEEDKLRRGRGTKREDRQTDWRRKWREVPRLMPMQSVMHSAALARAHCAVRTERKEATQ